MSIRHRLALTGSGLSSTLARWTQPGFVKSVQRGSIAITAATSNTATITAVDVSNSRLINLGQTNDTDAANIRESAVLLTLTNGTTVTASVATSPGGETSTVSFEVIEYYPGVIKSVQRSTIAITVTANTATISAVTVLKSTIDVLGQTSTQAGQNPSSYAWATLTNTTTVTATRGTATGGTSTLGFQVVEWF